MLGEHDGPEEWVPASDGIRVAVMDATWHTGMQRTIAGASDLRCKIQLDGQSQLSMGDSTDTLGSDGKLTFLYKPVGCIKREVVVPGVSERSLTFVFPVFKESLAGYTRDDPAVDRVLRSFNSDIMMRRLKTSAPILTKASSLLGLNRSARSFARLRRSKLDELACLVLDLFVESFLEDRSCALTARECRQINDARDILLANLADPPSLTALAASVGTNRTKLNQGFNLLMGMPVYRFLQRERMLSAKTWLETESFSISDVAEACGYEHVSNFSNAFKAYYGHTPSSLRER